MNYVHEINTQWILWTSVGASIGASIAVVSGIMVRLLIKMLKMVRVKNKKGSKNENNHT